MWGESSQNCENNCQCSGLITDSFRINSGNSATKRKQAEAAATNFKSRMHPHSLDFKTPTPLSPRSTPKRRVFRELQNSENLENSPFKSPSSPFRGNSSPFKSPSSPFKSPKSPLASPGAVKNLRVVGENRKVLGEVNAQSSFFFHSQSSLVAKSSVSAQRSSSEVKTLSYSSFTRPKVSPVLERLKSETRNTQDRTSLSPVTSRIQEARRSSSKISRIFDERSQFKMTSSSSNKENVSSETFVEINYEESSLRVEERLDLDLEETRPFGFQTESQTNWSMTKLNFTDALHDKTAMDTSKMEAGGDFCVPEKDYDIENTDFETLHDLEEEFENDNFDLCTKYEIISTDSPNIISRGRTSSSRKVNAKNFVFGAPIGQHEQSTSFDAKPNVSATRMLNFEDENLEFTSPTSKKRPGTSFSVKKSLKFSETGFGASETSFGTSETVNNENGSELGDTPTKTYQPVGTPPKSLEKTFKLIDIPSNSNGTPTKSGYDTFKFIDTPSKTIVTPSKTIGTPSKSLKLSGTPTKSFEKTFKFLDTPSKTTGTPSKTIGTPTKSFKSGTPAKSNPLRHEHSGSSIGSMFSSPSSNQGHLRLFTSESTTSMESGFISELEEPFMELEEASNSPKMANFKELLSGPIKDDIFSSQTFLKRPLMQRSLSFNTEPKVKQSLFTAERNSELKKSQKRQEPLLLEVAHKRRKNASENSPKGKAVRPIFQRAFSENHASIMSALSRSCLEPDLIADFSAPYALPLTTGQHSDLKAISCDTLAQLLNGEYCDTVGDYQVIDCRYPYEFDGGHIATALNLYTPAQIRDLLNTPLARCGDGVDSVSGVKRSILVFHCEFSLERGPKLYRYLRSSDRSKNAENYPSLNYPEVYLLHEGYRTFYQRYPSLCTPAGYTAMLDPNHTHLLRKHRSTEEPASFFTHHRSKGRQLY